MEGRHPRLSEAAAATLRPASGAARSLARLLLQMDGKMKDISAERTVVLTLSGHEPVPGRADLEFRPRSERMTRGVASLVGFTLLAVVVAILPPHIPWALIALIAGGIVSVRNFRGVFTVRSFEGNCPRCGAALTIEPGARIKPPHEMDCYSCHFHPMLEVR